MARDNSISCAMNTMADVRPRTHISLAMVASYFPGSEERASLNFMKNTEGLASCPCQFNVSEILEVYWHFIVLWVNWYKPI